MNHTIRLLEDDNYDLNDHGEPEYDFAELRRRAKLEGREYRGQASGRLAKLAPDVAAFFPNDEALNRALREIIVSQTQSVQRDAQQPIS